MIFKPGDKIKCIDDSPFFGIAGMTGLVLNKVYIVEKSVRFTSKNVVYIAETGKAWLQTRFKLVQNRKHRIKLP